MWVLLSLGKAPGCAGLGFKVEAHLDSSAPRQWGPGIHFSGVLSDRAALQLLTDLILLIGAPRNIRAGRASCDCVPPTLVSAGKRLHTRPCVSQPGAFLGRRAHTHARSRGVWPPSAGGSHVPCCHCQVAAGWPMKLIEARGWRHGE
jgi:hypothetical protein